MLDLNISQKKLIRKYLPQFSYDDLRSFESKGTILYQYYLDMKAREDSAPGATKELNQILENKRNEADKAFKDHIHEINELWVARRLLALQLGKFSVCSGSFSRYIKAVADYHWIQVKLYKLKLKVIKDKLARCFGINFLFKKPEPGGLFKDISETPKKVK